MMITSSKQAMEILDDVREEAALREAAIRYLAKTPTPAVIARLVQAMQDDDFSVRWEAASVFAQLGETAVLEVLKALTGSARVGDPRLRECAYHILHSNAASVPVPITDLLEALRGGPAADIASLVEADRVLRALEKYRSLKARDAGKPGETGATQTNILSLKYGPARLTGRLSRLGGHRFR
jgi:HEAT repeat protein